MFKVSNKVTKTTSWKRSVFAEFRANHCAFWYRFSVFIINFEHNVTPFSSVPTIDFKQVNVSWENFMLVILINMNNSKLIKLLVLVYYYDSSDSWAKITRLLRIPFAYARDYRCSPKKVAWKISQIVRKAVNLQFY